MLMRGNRDGPEEQEQVESGEPAQPESSQATEEDHGSAPQVVASIVQFRQELTSLPDQSVMERLFSSQNKGIKLIPQWLAGQKNRPGRGTRRWCLFVSMARGSRSPSRRTRRFWRSCAKTF